MQDGGAIPTTMLQKLRRLTLASIEIPLPEQVRERLLALGIDEKNIDSQMAIYVSLYQQALKGNVNACSQYLKLFANDEPAENTARDITKDVEAEEKRIIKSLACLSKELLNANKDFIHQLAFMSVTLKDLSIDIAKNGVKEQYKNGANQWRLQRPHRSKDIQQYV